MPVTDAGQGKTGDKGRREAPSHGFERVDVTAKTRLGILGPPGVGNGRFLPLVAAVSGATDHAR